VNGTSLADDVINLWDFWGR